MWLTDPKPCSETVTVRQRNGVMVVSADDTAQGLTFDRHHTRPLEQHWVLKVMDCYDSIIRLREADDGTHKNAVIRHHPA